MIDTLQHKSYADEDFVALKEKHGDLLVFSLDAAKRMNQIAMVLRTWYKQNFDIRFKRTGSYLLAPYIIVYYPTLIINDGKYKRTLNDFIVIYDLIFSHENVNVSSSIWITKATYTTKEMLQRYTHSHVNSSVENSFEANIFTAMVEETSLRPPLVVNARDYAEPLCLGSDEIQKVIADLTSQNDENVEKLFTYFFGYMDALLAFENSTGAYGGMRIKQINNVTFNDDNFKRINIQHDRFSQNTLTEDLTDYFRFIKKIIFDGKMLRIISFTDDIGPYLESKFGSVVNIFELDHVFYTKTLDSNSQRSNQLRNLLAKYDTLKEPLKSGFVFRDSVIPFRMINDLKINKNDTSMYQKVIHPEFINSLTVVLTHQLNTKYHERVFNQTTCTSLFQNID